MCQVLRSIHQNLGNTFFWSINSRRPSDTNISCFHDLLPELLLLWRKLTDRVGRTPPPPAGCSMLHQLLSKPNTVTIKKLSGDFSSALTILPHFCKLCGYYCMSKQKARETKDCIHIRSNDRAGWKLMLLMQCQVRKKEQRDTTEQHFKPLNSKRHWNSVTAANTMSTSWKLIATDDELQKEIDWDTALAEYFNQWFLTGCWQLYKHVYRRKSTGPCSAGGTDDAINSII